MFGWLTGGDKLVVRGGYSMVYDRIGQALATRFDQVGSFGLSTQLSSNVNANNEDNPDIRFQAINVHSEHTAGSASRRLPADAAGQAGQITSALDSSIKTPYSHVYNVVVGRELGGDYSHRSRLRRAQRTQPADPARPDDAAELQGPEGGQRTTSPPRSR